jgi:predicted nucleic-acid-binding protein
LKGVDTNVVLRLLLEDDLGQAERARNAIRRERAGGRCWVNRIVVCEAVWVLQSAYGYPREQIGDAVQALLRSDELRIEEDDIVRSALYAFRISRAGFADCLLGMSNGFQGSTRTLTFDRRAAELNEFEVI